MLKHVLGQAFNNGSPVIDVSRSIFTKSQLNHHFNILEYERDVFHNIKVYPKLLVFQKDFNPIKILNLIIFTKLIKACQDLHRRLFRAIL